MEHYWGAAHLNTLFVNQPHHCVSNTNNHLFRSFVHLPTPSAKAWRQHDTFNNPRFPPRP